LAVCGNHFNLSQGKLATNTGTKAGCPPLFELGSDGLKIGDRERKPVLDVVDVLDCLRLVIENHVHVTTIGNWYKWHSILANCYRKTKRR
jgi:hypothetical protein